MTVAMADAGVQLTTRPRYEGANIRTWVGFKHFMYLAEEGVLEWFRQRGYGPSRLYHEHGLGLEVVDSSVQLPSVLDIDDLVAVDVKTSSPGRFAVTATVDRDGHRTVALKGKLQVALVAEPHATAGAPPPAELLPLVVPGVTGDAAGTPETAGFAWSWQARYFHCHYSARIQHSAYVRALEETVDRFLADRGLSIRRVLQERAWIPVVSRARVRLLADARMDEVVDTTFVVDDVYKRAGFDGRMDCHVMRDGERVMVATARILHGYAVSRGPEAGRVAELDDVTLAALTREVPR